MRTLPTGAFLLLVTLLIPSATATADKLRFGTAVKLVPHYYLPLLAAEEKGIWEKYGLKVEWTPFTGGTAHMKAVAAGEISVGVTSTNELILATSAGIPVMAIAEFIEDSYTSFFVHADSPIKEPKTIAGRKIAITQFGAGTHRSAQAVVKGLGLEKGVKIVAAGGIRQGIAAFRARLVDVIVSTRFTFGEQWMKGEVRELLRVADYLPKPWVEDLVITRKGFARQNRVVLRGLVKALFESVESIRLDAAWAIDKMKSQSGYLEGTARRLYEDILQMHTRGGNINELALMNVMDFSIQFGVIPRGKMPVITELYTKEFIE